MDPIPFLQSHALFGGLTDEELQCIIPLLEVRKFPRGCDIVTETETGRELYLLLEGRVEVIKICPNHPEKAPLRLAELESGDSFGEMHLIDIQSRSATVRTLEETTAYALSHHNIYHLHLEHPDIFTKLILNIARELSRRLRKMDEWMGSILFKAEEPGALRPVATPATPPDA